jgi:hypothetical protein
MWGLRACLGRGASEPGRIPADAKGGGPKDPGPWAGVPRNRPCALSLAAFVFCEVSRGFEPEFGVVRLETRALRKKMSRCVPRELVRTPRPCQAQGPDAAGRGPVLGYMGPRASTGAEQQGPEIGTAGNSGPGKGSQDRLAGVACGAAGSGAGGRSTRTVPGLAPFGSSGPGAPRDRELLGGSRARGSPNFCSVVRLGKDSGFGSTRGRKQGRRAGRGPFCSRSPLGEELGRPGAPCPGGDGPKH